MLINNLIEYSSNYSETARSLWFYSKDQVANLNADISNNNDFKSFKYKSKWLEADGANEILKNATIAVPLKYLSNFWRSRKMPLIDYKVGLKLKWRKYCVLSKAGNDNMNFNNEWIIISIIMNNEFNNNEYEAFVNLKNNKNIIIQKAYKGNSVVIIDRMSYIAKMEELLSDRSKFLKVEFNSKYKVNYEIRHLLDMKKEIKSCLDNVQNSSYLSEDG